MENIFYVPEAARWKTIAAAAHTAKIGTVIDNVMRSIESENNSLKNVLPKNYASPDLDQRVLGDVVDVFTNMDIENSSADILGTTYQYCIRQFAAYEGVKGGEFYTPESVVKTIVAILKPFENCRIYDSCCGSGGMFVQSAEFVEVHQGNRNQMAQREALRLKQREAYLKRRASGKDQAYYEKNKQKWKAARDEAKEIGAFFFPKAKCYLSSVDL